MCNNKSINTPEIAATPLQRLYLHLKSAADFLAALGFFIWNIRTLAAIGREWEQDAAAYAADGVEME